MSNNIHLQVITPERILLDEAVQEVILPTKNGQIAILPHHIPLVTEIVPGELIVKAGKNDEKIALVYGGFVYVKEKSEVIVLADSAEHLHELNEEEILKAKAKAEEAKLNATHSKERIAEAESVLARSITQLKTLKKHGHRHTAKKNIKID